jgi:hypothetical protein
VARDESTRLSALDACSVDDTENVASPLLISGVETLFRCEIKLSRFYCKALLKNSIVNKCKCSMIVRLTVLSFKLVSPVRRESVSCITIRNRSGSSDSRTE